MVQQCFEGSYLGFFHISESGNAQKVCYSSIGPSEGMYKGRGEKLFRTNFHKDNYFDEILDWARL